MWQRKRGRDLLRPHERLVLDAVRGWLEPAAATLLDGQVARIEMIQRHQDGREVNLYPNRHGPQRHDPALDFPDRTVELRLATVTLRGSERTGKASIFVIKGHLFSILLSVAPGALGRPGSIEVASVTIHADPLVSRVDAGTEQRLGELASTVRAELESLWARDPPDDRGLAAPDETYRIQLDDGEYLILGQLDDTSYLAAPIDPCRPGVRRFWPDGDVLRDYRDVETALADR